MKRSGPPKRRKALSPDPEKVREFQKRGKISGAKSLQKSARDGLRARSKVRKEEGPLAPKQWRIEVARASDLRSVVSIARADDPDDPDFEAHHCLPKNELRRRGLHAYVWDPRNGVWLTEREHARHTSAFLRVPRSALPPSVWEFCAEMDALGRGEWATALVQRLHPAARDSRIPE